MDRRSTQFPTIIVPLAIALAVHLMLVVVSMHVAEGDGSFVSRAVRNEPFETPLRVSDEPLLVPPEPTEFRVGDEAGTGNSLQDAPSDRLNLAKLAEAEQPLTRVEPKMPSSDGGPQDAGDVQPQQLAGASRSMFDRVPLAKMPGDVIEPTEPSPPGAPVEKDGPAQQQQQQQPAPSPAQHAAAPSQEALDPSMFANNDMDAFSTEAGIDMTPGTTKVRAGRPIDKLRQPRIDLAFAADARAIRGTIGVVYTISIDDAGKPRDVSIAKSSGSVTIDEAWRRALLETTFGGKKPDTFTFGVAIVVD
jgi:TonB family protein